MSPRRIACWFLLFASCASQNTSSTSSAGGDLPVGDVDDSKADAAGGYGSALDCKDVPDLPPLVAPRITLSIEGLTLHLTDAATGYDKVFAVGPGAYDTNPEDPEFGESLSYRPIIDTGSHDFAITPATIQTCKIWDTDPDTGIKTPLFAGLPFLSWHGNYAIHGPIDNYQLATGGTLRRGFVSHGCFRMEAAGILEVYARIKGVASVPVHVQREPERLATGARADVDPRWIGAECSADADCDYTGGLCAKNAYDTRGFCSARCTQYCGDNSEAPTTFCVDDPSAAGQGMCVPRAVAQDYECRSYTAMSVHAAVPRHGQPSVTAAVCLPGSQGWVGDRCATDTDCANGTTCAGGICTEACTQYCADEPGFPETFCATEPALGDGGHCVRQCTASSNASECPSGEVCASATRPNSSVTKTVCVPQ
jgi:hypothetical protein|nr:L,D-transpeptidase [Kofleriaceae bacterium]